MIAINDKPGIVDLIFSIIVPKLLFVSLPSLKIAVASFANILKLNNG